MAERHLTLPQLRNAGWEALMEKLGPVDAVRFLQLYDSGHGDYTEERSQRVEAKSIGDVLADLDEPARAHS